MDCLSVFDHFLGLVRKRLNLIEILISLNTEKALQSSKLQLKISVCCIFMLRLMKHGKI